MANFANSKKPDSMLKSQQSDGSFLEVQGGKIWYRIFEPELKATPIIVIHGGPGASHDYLLPLAKLSENRPVVFYDQLGCGFSQGNNDPQMWQVGRFVVELRQLIIHLGFKGFILIGHGWGAAIAVTFAQRLPASGLRAMVLSSPILHSEWWKRDQIQLLSSFPNEIDEAIKLAEKNRDFTSQSYQDAINAYYHKHFCRLVEWPECLTTTLSKMNHEMYQYMWGMNVFRQSGKLRFLDLTAKLEDLRLAVLYTCGEFDDASPKTCSYYQMLTKGSEMKVFNDSSHCHHLELTSEYLLTLTDFFNRRNQ